MAITKKKLFDFGEEKKYTDDSIVAAAPFISAGYFIVGCGFLLTTLGSFIPALAFLNDGLNFLYVIIAALVVSVPFVVLGYKKLIEK